MLPIATSTCRLLHRGTGRTAFVVRAEAFLKSTPISFDGDKYILFTASRAAVVSVSPETARLWIDLGTSCVCSWGPASSHLDDTFDWASFLPELGAPLPFVLMTTWHDQESLEDALRFAFYSAVAPNGPLAEFASVVVLVDSVDLQMECEQWVRTNTE
jgi:hypothetical protein